MLTKIKRRLDRWIPAHKTVWLNPPLRTTLGGRQVNLDLGEDQGSRRYKTEKGLLARTIGTALSIPNRSHGVKKEHIVVTKTETRLLSDVTYEVEFFRLTSSGLIKDRELILKCFWDCY